MGSKRRRLDPVGPFGNPDGSRADIEDVISEFVDFGGDPAYGHLATRANDSMVRVIVGRLGAGKRSTCGVFRISRHIRTPSTPTCRSRACRRPKLW
jgi:hypothetical protein